MTPPTESAFDLGLITDHLEVTLDWATLHRLPDGAHATSEQAQALAFWLVQAGSLRVRFEGDETGGDRNEIVLRAGDAVMMRTDRARTISSLQDVSWLSAGFRLRLFARDYTGHLFPPVFRWRPDPSATQTLSALLDVARAHCRLPEIYRPTPFPRCAPVNPVQQWVADGVARAVIHYLWQESGRQGMALPAAAGGKDTPHWLLPVLLHVATQPGAATVQSMSAIAGISQSQFNRLFRQFVGMSPQKQLIVSRMRSAAQLLLATEDTTAAVAKSVGFESTSHFTRLFAEHYGDSPAQYRARQRTLRL